MVRNLTARAKVLIGIAVGCAAYVVVMPDGGQTVEPARGSDAMPQARVRHPVTGKGTPPGVDLPFRAGDRVVQGDAVSSLFSRQSWYVAPPAAPPPPVVYQAPPPPAAPPLPFTFMGSYRSENAVSTYFLTSGDRVYDVKVGDTLNNTYSVDDVKAGQLLLTYMPLKIQQSIAVGEQ